MQTIFDPFQLISKSETKMDTQCIQPDTLPLGFIAAQSKILSCNTCQSQTLVGPPFPSRVACSWAQSASRSSLPALLGLALERAGHLRRTGGSCRAPRASWRGRAQSPSSSLCLSLSLCPCLSLALSMHFGTSVCDLLASICTLPPIHGFLQRGGVIVGRTSTRGVIHCRRLCVCEM